MPSGREVSGVGFPQLVLSESAAWRVCANKTSFSGQSLKPHRKAIGNMNNRGSDTIQKQETIEGRQKEMRRNCDTLFCKSDFRSLCNLKKRK